MQPQEWNVLFRQAARHNVLPLVYEAVYTCPAARRDAVLLRPYQQRVRHQVMLQALKTDAFLQLEQHLHAAGVTPLAVKGIICRNLYPKPDHRPSGDEDILIAPEQFAQCHAAMLSFGMQLSDAQQDIEAAFEVSYDKPDTGLHIELHKSLFPPESTAYGELNRYFTGCFDRKLTEQIEGILVDTMGETDHLFYLICHAFKHFLHSGFGIRQVCDIVLYANAYGEKIDWQYVLQCCQEIRADKFAAALFRIGEKYLVFDVKQACYPSAWTEIAVDETAMLEDLLSSGIYGASNMSRKHSSSITLHAVTADKTGRKRRNSVLKTVFPSAKQLENRYTYLKKKPYLLPAAWTQRLFAYRKETSAAQGGNSAAEALKIGSQRTELLRQYGIIR